MLPKQAYTRSSHNHSPISTYLTQAASKNWIHGSSALEWREKTRQVPTKSAHCSYQRERLINLCRGVYLRPILRDVSFARTCYCKPIHMPQLRQNSPFVMTKVSRKEKGSLSPICLIRFGSLPRGLNRIVWVLNAADLIPQATITYTNSNLSRDII